MKHLRPFMIITVLICLVLTGAVLSTRAANEEFPKIMAFGSGSVGGAYNMLAIGAAKYWDKEHNIKAKVVPGMSLSNLRLLAEGKRDLLVFPSSFSFAAWNGMESMGFPTPIQEFRIMFYVYPDMFHFVALKKSGLRTIADLKGKRVGCGTKASVFDKMIGERFEANGIKYFGDNPDIKKTFTNWEDMCRLVGDGNIDACITGLSGLSPQSSLQKLLQERELVALEWSTAALDDYKNPLFPDTVIKKGLLPYLEKDHRCILGGMASFIARKDLSEELVYALIKTVYSNLQQLADENPYWKYPIQYPSVLTHDIGVPYHPGAIKFWKEIGVWNR